MNNYLNLLFASIKYHQYPKILFSKLINALFWLIDIFLDDLDIKYHNLF